MTDDRSPTFFADHFSAHACDYARYRPDYPASLFDYLAAAAAARRLAWDCATGNGQAALALAARFERVVATDASEEQIREAIRDPRIEYRVAPAESAGLPDGCADLIAVAQALHWFDRPRFWKEATRVLAPDGVIAVWAYDLLEVSPAVDLAVRRLAREILRAWWPRERRIVDRGYGAIEFPFPGELSAPKFVMEKEWALADLLGYLRTWSAVRRYLASHDHDPVALVEPELSDAWGPPERRRRATWTLDLRVGRARE